MNKTVSIIITLALVVGLGIIFFDSGKEKIPENNVEIKDGVQYVAITARGGYFPNVSMARADMPTKLVVKTDGVFDCSLSLVIRSIGYQNILSQKGEEVIDLGVPKAGETLQGVCSMGMYSFQVRFN